MQLTSIKDEAVKRGLIKYDTLLDGDIRQDKLARRLTIEAMVGAWEGWISYDQAAEWLASALAERATQRSNPQ